MVRLVRLLPEDTRADLIDGGLRRALRPARARLVTLLVGVLYLVVYLAAARALVVDPEAHFSRFAAVPSLALAPRLSWRHLVDPIDPAAILYLSDAVVLALPLPILLAALVVGALVGMNVAVAVETLALRATQCARASALGLLASLPAFLGSFACCAPTVLLALGANAAVAVVAIVPYVVPVAIAALAASLAWSARRLELIARGEVAALAR